MPCRFIVKILFISLSIQVQGKLEASPLQARATTSASATILTATTVQVNNRDGKPRLQLTQSPELAFYLHLKPGKQSSGMKTNPLLSPKYPLQAHEITLYFN